MNGSVTLSEIRQQPTLWPGTLDRVAHRSVNVPPLITGASPSALSGDRAPLRIPFDILFPQLLALLAHARNRRRSR